MRRKTVAHNWVKPEARQRFIAVATELAEATRQEDGCIDYQLCVDLDDELHLMFVEEWESAAHLEAHRHTPHFQRLAPQLGECTSRPHQLLRMEPIG